MAAPCCAALRIPVLRCAAYPRVALRLHGVIHIQVLRTYQLKSGKSFSILNFQLKDVFLRGKNKKEKDMEYTAIIKEMSNGWYFTQCEQVPGAMTQGKTIEEALENLKEAIQLVLEAEREHDIVRHVDKTIIRRELVTV